MAKGLVESSTMTAIADAIREKTGSTDTYTPAEMVEAIANIQGGGVTPETFEIKDSVSYLFSSPVALKVKDQITTKDIVSLSRMFFEAESAKGDWSSFIINLPQEGAYAPECKYFAYNSRISHVPTLVRNNCKIGVTDASYCFSNAQYLLELPEVPFWDSINGSWIDRRNMFYNAQSIKRIPPRWLAEPNEKFYTSTSNNLYYNGFYNCRGLIELVDLPIRPSTAATEVLTSNIFYSTFPDTHKLKRLVFETQEDGTPIEWKAHSQTIDLTVQVGYGSVGPNGIDTKKRITNDETYEQYKDDEEAWAGSLDYSWYNHDSAVETINSLPDTSAYLATVSGKKNTIKFKGSSGAKTDGGAINTLTDEEIAVATEKGWTIAMT